MWECVCRSTPLTHWNGIPPGDVKALTFGPCPGILSLARVCPASNHTHLKTHGRQRTVPDPGNLNYPGYYGHVIYRYIQYSTMNE